jgi:pilus assembly protein TadC
VAKPKADPQIEPLPSWKTFLFELLIYGALLFAYFYLVLHYLSGWFKELFDHDRQLYAVMALVIMIGQTVCLEVVSALLLWLTRRRKA